MRAAVEDDVLVDLVADGIGVVRLDQAGDERQLVRTEHLARRVMRGVEDEELGPGRESRLKRVFRQLPAGRLQADQTRNAAGAADERQIRIVERLDQHHLIARRDQPEAGCGEGLGGAGGDQHLGLPVEIEPVMAPIVPGHRLPQRRQSLHRRVLVGTGEAGGGGRLAHGDGAVFVREALAEVDRAVLAGERAHH